MASTLLHLPPELIETIVAATDGPGLLAFRLASRETSRLSDKVFVARYFIHRRHLVTRHSFQTLLDISRNERLRRKLTTIELVVTNLSSWIATRGNPDAQHTAQERRCSSSSAPPLHQQSVWSHWCPEDDEDTRGRADTSMLSDALANLTEAGVIPELKLSTQGHLSPVPYGFRRLVTYLRSMGQTCIDNEYWLLGRWPDDNGDTAALLLSAVAQAQFPVRKLGLSGKQAPLSHGSLTRIATCFSTLRHLHYTPSQLKTLSLCVGCVHTLGARDFAVWDALSRSAPLLQDVHLDFVNGCCGAPKSFLPPRILVPFAGHALETIHLTGAVLRQRHLCAFLAHHQQSLRTLRLRHVAVGPRDSFAAVFTFMQEELSLQSLVLHWLQQGHEHMDEVTGRGNEYAYSGQEEVKAGLRELSRTVTFGDPPLAPATVKQGSCAGSVG